MTERRRLDVLRVALLIAAAAAHLTWLASVSASLGTPELARRDWSAFREAGRAVLEGEAATLYAPRPGGFPFLHPPSVAVLAAPASGLGDLAFYGLMVALCVLGLAISAAALREPGRARVDVVVLLTLASAPWLIALTLGQPLTLLVASWLLGCRALGVSQQRGREQMSRSSPPASASRPLRAGLLWSLCALKPPLLLPLFAYAALRRSPRALAGLAIGAAVLLALALPLGLDVYAGWVAAMSRELGPAAVSWKQHTLLATLRALLPSTMAWVAWAVALLGLGGLTLRRIWRAPHGLRALGWLALATIVLSPYAYFYDALLFVVPTAALVLERDAYAPRRWRLLVACAALTFATQHLAFFVLQTGPPIGALPAVGWLLLEILSGPSGSRTRPGP